MRNKKETAKNGAWLIKVVIKVIVKFFIYLTVYIRNFNKLKMHVFGFFMSIVSIIFLPRFKFCSITEWIMFLIFTSFTLSGAVSGYVYAKLKGKTETTQVLQNENPHYDRSDAQAPNEQSSNYEPIYTIEEGIEDIIPLENGGVRRIYKVRRG